MYYSEFGDNLRKLRKSRNLTQKELGMQVGLSKAVVSKYENSLVIPPLMCLSILLLSLVLQQIFS